VYFTDIDQARERCKWGFYLGTEGLPRGTGSALGYYGLSYAFAELPFVQEIVGEVLGTNLRSVTLHERLGFVEIGVMEATRNDRSEQIVSFALSRAAWTKAKRSVAERLFD
jgi:RimJ/RimL family protein N-acetyltransferase